MRMIYEFDTTGEAMEFFLTVWYDDTEKVKALRNYLPEHYSYVEIFEMDDADKKEVAMEAMAESYTDFLENYCIIKEGY